MRVHFWGVRGSLPVPGPKTARYGGNTSCVGVRSSAGTCVVVDAGTGVRKLGKALMQEERFQRGNRAHLLISHTHWDHIQGLPFFSPLNGSGNEISVYARGRDQLSLASVFASQSQAPYFPVSLQEVKAKLTFRELTDTARFEIDDVKVACARLNHPNVATAYRIAVDGAVFVYVTDTAPFEHILFDRDFVGAPPAPGAALSPQHEAALRAMRSDLVKLCEGADLVAYDTMFTAEDYERMPHYGHSRPSDALAICREAGAKALVLFHHAPERSDAEVDAILAETRRMAQVSAPSLSIWAAYEGLEFTLGRHP